MHTWLGPDVQMLLRHIRRQLDTTCLLLPCIGIASYVVFSEEFFFTCRSGFIMKFSRFAFPLKRLQLDSRTGLITNGLIFGFLLECASFCRRHICRDWNLQELLKCDSLLTTLFFYLQKREFYLLKNASKKAPHAVYMRYLQFTLKRVKFTCFYAASTSLRIQIAWSRM